MTQEFIKNLPDRMIDIKTVTEILSVSKRTIFYLINDPVNPLPSHKIGGKRLFKLSEINKYIRSL